MLLPSLAAAVWTVLTEGSEARGDFAVEAVFEGGFDFGPVEEGRWTQVLREAHWRWEMVGCSLAIFAGSEL